jgi:hypothetical protein
MKGFLVSRQLWEWMAAFLLAVPVALWLAWLSAGCEREGLAL